MTKQELYEKIKARGVKLDRGAQFYTLEALTELYNSTSVAAAQDECAPEPEKVKICPLEFSTDGWCPELGKAYTQGVYLPETAAEYKALKKYAARELQA